MNNFQFDGLSDFDIENTQSIFGKFVLYAMLVVFALASMVTTFSFFATYAPRLGEAIHPAYGGYIAGCLGILLFDLAGLGWTVLRARNSDTTKQFVIATLAAGITISLSLLTSGLQVLLSTSFDVGLYDSVNNLTRFGQAMQLMGVGTMTLGFVVNFGAIAAFVNTSKEVLIAVQSTQLAGYMTAGRFMADNTRARLVIQRTLQGIISQLPNYAQMAGTQNASEYLGHVFNGDQGAAIPLAETFLDVPYRVALMKNKKVVQYYNAPSSEAATVIATQLSQQGFYCEVETKKSREWVFVSGWKNGRLWATPLPDDVMDESAEDVDLIQA